MVAKLIDGKRIAETLCADLAVGVRDFFDRTGVTPGLAVVVVGDDPASAVYVRNKIRQTTTSGMRSFEHRLPADADQGRLLELIRDLNEASEVHGILVQLPLPRHINASKVIAAIDPAKDVDGFHPHNVGNFSIGRDAFVPCTPLGCLSLIRSVLRSLSGAFAVVLGRSNIVGKPMAQLLIGADATVAVVHSKSIQPERICAQADILVAAVGRPELVRGDWVKPGAIVIDVGINRVVGPDGRSRLVGDVAFDEARMSAGFITPVPGGVGPMTIASLLSNTLIAAKRATGSSSSAT